MADHIGSLVKRFESASKGSLALAQCGNDWGLSCGSYQLTLRWGNCINFLKAYFPSEASSLYFNNLKDIKSATWPGADYCSSPDEVKAVWMKCYNSVGAEKFEQCEISYIQEHYYNQLMKKLADYFNPNQHSRMIQECMWSWAVHRGVGTAASEFKAACSAAGIDNPNTTLAEDLIDIVYDKRYSTFSAYNRYKKGAGDNSEREVLRAYCNTAPLPYDGDCPGDGTVANGVKQQTSEDSKKETNAEATTESTEKKTTTNYYRVGTAWKNGKCVNQTGAYTVLSNAIKNCKTNQSVFDSNGVAVYTGVINTNAVFTPYRVRVITDVLNVRKTPNTSAAIVTKIKRGEIYTIVDESKTATGTWGQLKSKVGWISLSYVTKTS
jgi:hypothetical protein